MLMDKIFKAYVNLIGNVYRKFEEVNREEERTNQVIVGCVRKGLEKKVQERTMEVKEMR